MRPTLLTILVAAAALVGASELPAQAADDHDHEGHLAQVDNAPGEPPCPQSYTLTQAADLGGTADWALGLSDSGWVVGTARTGTALPPQAPVRQRGDSVTALGMLEDATFARGMDVNNRGTAVGEAFTGAPETSRAARWGADGAIRALPGLDGPGAVANASNNRGDVVGASSGHAVIWPATGNARQTVQALPRHTGRSGAVARATDVDEDGTVVGSSTVWFTHGDHEHARPRAMRWDRGAVTHLGGLAEDRASVALAVSGQYVVGEASNQAGTSKAVFFGEGAAHELPALGRWTHSRANDVNTDGVVVGHESRFAGNTSFGGSAVVWCDEKAVALDDVVSGLPAGWALQSAEAVNDAGQIVGYGSNGQETVSFVVTPAP